MYCRIPTILFCLMPLYLCTWRVYDKPPSSARKDGEKIEGIFEFTLLRLHRECCYCPDSVNISVLAKYMINKSPEKNNSCILKKLNKTTDYGFVLKCRRKKEFHSLHSIDWMKQALAEYLWESKSNYMYLTAAFCVLRRLKEMSLPELPTVEIITTKTPTTSVAATSFTKQTSGISYKTTSATKDGGYSEMYISDEKKQVEPKERSIVSLLIVIGPLVVIKLLLLILLVLTLRKLRATERHKFPEALPTAEKKEESKDNLSAKTGATL